MAAVAAIASTGCMTLRIETTPDAAVRVSRHVLGLLRVDVAQPDKAVVGTLSGLGLAATPMGWSAGYTRQRWTAIGPACRAVVWIDGAALDARARDALAAAAGACVFDGTAAAVDATASAVALKESAP